MKTLLIGNLIYLPINKDYGDKSEQKYVTGDMNGNIYMSEILTRDEIYEKHKASELPLSECKGIKGIVENY